MFVGALCVSEVADEARHALALAAVQLAHIQRALAPDEDATGRNVVGAEVDEGTHGPVVADACRDRRLVHAVLERNDEALRGESRRDGLERRLGVVRLHREENRAQAMRQSVGRYRRRARGELLDRPLDRQTPAVDLGNMGCVRVAEQDVMSVACETRADRPTNRPRPDHHVLHSLTLRRRGPPTVPAAQPSFAFASSMSLS